MLWLRLLPIVYDIGLVTALVAECHQCKSWPGEKMGHKQGVCIHTTHT